MNGHLLDRIKVSVITEAGHENCSRKQAATRVVRKRWPPIGACLAYNKHLECKHQVIITFFLFYCFLQCRKLATIVNSTVQCSTVELRLSGHQRTTHNLAVLTGWSY